MRLATLGLPATVTAMVVGLAGTASANGRFPRAQRVFEMPGRPDKLVIQATYGLLFTEDRGKNWSYVCDAAFAFQNPFASDGVVALTADGSLLVGVQKSVTRSTDWGCDFKQVLVPTGTTSVDDFASMPSRPDELVALTTTFDAGNFIVRLQESMDGGLTWKEIGSRLPASLVYTIDVDPTNANHLYVTGSKLSADANEPELFLTSNDRGTTWEIGTVPGTNVDASPWIAAVHPRDGNKIFVRTDSWKTSASGQRVAGDALLYSDNGGKTWTELLRLGGSDPEVPGAKLLGFALSPDGNTALVGYGDIVDAVLVVDPDKKYMGLYKSSSDGRYSFGSDAPAAATPLFKMPTTCLGWTSQGAYACFAPQDQSQYMAFSADASFAAGSTTTLMKASEVQGQSCACKGRAVSECTWSVDCAALGACRDSGAGAGGMCGGSGGAAGAGGAGGAGGSAGGAGAIDSGAGGSTGGTAGTADASAGTGGTAGGSAGAGGTSNSGDGCGCRVPDASRSDYRGGAAAALLLVGRLFRKRRRSPIVT